MAISFDNKKIVLIPNKKHPHSCITINNHYGAISVTIYEENISKNQLDILVEDLKLAQQISDEIKSPV